MRTCILEHPRLPSTAHFNDIAHTPLWSCLMGGYGAAALAAAGHEVHFFDTTVNGWDFGRTANAILELDPALLAVNTVYLWEQTPALFAFFSELRNKGWAGHLNLFGFFPTLAWRQILTQAPAVDSVALGEFEGTLPRLAAALEQNADYGAIDGLAIRGRTTAFALARPTDPDQFPVPWRAAAPERTVNILASRGCYNHCRFCPIPSFYNDGPLWRGRDPRLVYDEIAALVDRGARNFYFVDPNFVGPGRRGRERTEELLRLIRPLPIRFGMETRPNDLDPRLLGLLKEAGLEALLLGIESGSPGVLDKLSKGASSQASARAIALCREVDIEPEIGFLMFVPDSDLADLRHNLAFLEKNRLLDRLDRTANLLSHRQIVLRGTSGYRRFQEQGRLRAHGMFGFEGTVRFRDPRVAVTAELLIHACHTILRRMGDPASPIYWRRPAGEMHHACNRYLVRLCRQLLEEENGGQREETQRRQQEITSAIDRILDPGVLDNGGHSGQQGY